MMPPVLFLAAAVEGYMCHDTHEQENGDLKI